MIQSTKKMTAAMAMNSQKARWISRRNFFRKMGAGTLMGALNTGLPLSSLYSPFSLAQGVNSESDGPYEGKFLLFCTFEGGWDQLLAADPRDATDSRFGPGKAINPGYDLIKDSDEAIERAVDELTGGTGVYQPEGSRLTVGPAMTKLADEHWQDLCLIRGMDMGTLTHAVGRRYFLTGKFPRGLQASGASLVTAAAGSLGEHTPLINLVMGMETFNDKQPTWASGLSVNQASDILSVLSPLNTPLDVATQQAVEAYLANVSAYEDALNSGNQLVSRFRESIPTADALASGGYAEHFDYKNPIAETAATLSYFGVESESDMAEAPGQAFIAAQAITQGIAQCVSVRLASGLDNHDDSWLSDHGPGMRLGFDTLSQLISYLKTHRDHNDQPYWDRTVLVASSEFARTPIINSQFGRDHHLSSSCIVAGAGIRGNTVIGGTDDTYTRLRVNPITGETGDGRSLIRPPDVHASILAAMGLPYDHLANQVPTILEAMLA